LIGNAIKFTDKGSVDVRLSDSLNPSKPDASWLIVEIQDTGPGISPQDQQILFDRFRQGSHKRYGSGLGLHLSKKIAETHNGTIEIKSELGQGSLFIVRLPVHQ
jgi:signal transduction histidine kinase